MLAIARRLRNINTCPPSPGTSSGSGFRDILNAIVSLRSVLLVDSDPAVHQVLAGVLKRDDRQVQDVYDGKEALALLRVSAYDLLYNERGNAVLFVKYL